MASNDGCVEFQQMMYNYFGDRDYDSFDFEEFSKLEDKIGFALYGPPKSKTGYNDKEKKKIQTLLEIIVNESNLISKWKDRIIISIIYNCLEPLPEEKEKRAKKYPDKPESDLNPIPIFILRKCKNSKHPCRVFIDDTGRVYKTWEEYLTENKYPECNMVLPKNGQYQENDNGVILEKHLSPACGIETKILQGTDIASAVGGVASGGVMVAAAIPTVAVAPVALVAAITAGIGIGAYSIGRSIYTLYDRKKHKETLSFANSESRGAYLNIVAGAMGFVGAGANMAVSQLATKGVTIGYGTKAAFNAVNVANLSASGVSVVNASYDVLDQWIKEEQAPSALTILQLTSSIFFFGHAVYSFQTANTIIKESQVKSLTEIRDSLQSNKQKRMFNKLLKETIRQNNGNVQQGQAQVIQSIKNMDYSQDQVFGIFSRWNKMFNKNKVRFAVKDGQITLNGVVVDITEFGGMDQDRVITYLGKLPDIPNPSQGDIRSLSTLLKNAFGTKANENWAYLATGLLPILGGGENRQKIINAVASLIAKLAHLDSQLNYMEWLERIFLDHRKYFALINMANNFFQKLVNKAEEKYQTWFETRDASLEEAYFFRLSLDDAKRASEIFNFVTETYFTLTGLSELGLRELLNYFYIWFAKQIISYQENQERKQQRINHSDGLRAPKVKCPKCNGVFYNRKLLST